MHISNSGQKVIFYLNLLSVVQIWGKKHIFDAFSNLNLLIFGIRYWAVPCLEL